MSTVSEISTPTPTDNSQLARVKLKKNEERRLKSGHLWVYSNEIDTKETPLSNFEPGQHVVVEDSKGKSIGVAYINPQSLITARFMSRDGDCAISESLLTHRLKIALSLRDKCYEGGCYRWVYGDSDGLPGIVVDRFGEYVVVQLNPAGMDCLVEQVVSQVPKVICQAGL